MSTKPVCPRCGSIHVENLEPGRYRCLGEVSTPTGAPPSGAFGPTETWAACTEVFVDPGHIGAGAATQVLCDCGTFAVGQCVECQNPKCATHSRLVGARRLCSQCESREQAKANAAAANEEAKLKKERTEAEAIAAATVPELTSKLLRSSISPTDLRFTTTMVAYHGSPLRLDGAEGRQQLRQQKHPKVGSFEGWLKASLEHGKKRHKYAMCKCSGWRITSYTRQRGETRASVQLWLLEDGTAVEAQKGALSRNNYPEGLPEFWIHPTNEGLPSLSAASGNTVSESTISASLLRILGS